MTPFPEPTYVDVSGVRLATYQAGPADASPPVVLVHGWPEIAYSWKLQIGPLVRAGFRVIALDLKGFGRSDAPTEPSAYDIVHMTDDLAGLLDALGVDRAIFCGHDWGGAIVWPMAQLHPARVAGVIGVSTPHRAPPPTQPTALLERRFGRDHYIVRFQERDHPERLLADGVETFFKLIFRRPPPREAWASLMPRAFDLLGRLERGAPADDDGLVVAAEDIAVYVDAYRRSGFTGGLNLYRNIDRNYEIMKAIDPVIAAPALWIGAELDMFLPPESAADMPAIVPDLEQRVIDGCGHWVTWEAPDRLNTILIDWLTRRFGP